MKRGASSVILCSRAPRWTRSVARGWSDTIAFVGVYSLLAAAGGEGGTGGAVGWTEADGGADPEAACATMRARDPRETGGRAGGGARCQGWHEAYRGWRGPLHRVHDDASEHQPAEEEDRNERAPALRDACKRCVVLVG